jgi:hypothetical protein
VGSENALEQKILELQQHDLELEAAHAAVRELGHLLSRIVHSDDIAAETVDVVNNVADLVLRNQYQAMEIARLESELEDVDEENGENDEECQCSPTLTNASTLRKLPTDDCDC